MSDELNCFPTYTSTLLRERALDKANMKLSVVKYTRAIIEMSKRLTQMTMEFRIVYVARQMKSLHKMEPVSI